MCGRREGEEDIANHLDEGSLLALPGVQRFQQPTMAVAQNQDITKHLFDELVN